ncbi:MAG: hypothetical protein PVJ57_07155 [Phycisphaerae bacterium]|jgi:hypothetical protein
MRRFVDIAVDRLRTLQDLGAQTAVFVRTDRRLRILFILSAVVVLVLVAGFYWTFFGGAEATPAGDADDAWRYLVVCSNCGYRERCTEHPAHHLEQRHGALKCPKCGEFKAAWYRRGGQALPPGGW